MASRVNTKFLLILAVCTIFVVGVLGGLFYLQYRGDAERHIRRGDELMAAGDYRGAYLSYGRAVSKNRSSKAYLAKFTEALLQVRPDNRDEANSLYWKRIGALQQAISYYGDEAQPHIELQEELLSSARLMSDSDDAWKTLATAAADMLVQVPEADPDRIEGRLYGGIAGLRRSFQLTDAELDAAEVDLKSYVAERPQSDKGWSALIRFYLSKSEKTRLDGAENAADSLLRDAWARVLEAREQVPDGPDVARATALAMLWCRRHEVPIQIDGQPVDEEDIDQAVDRMERAVLEADDGLLILDAAEILERRSGRPRAIAMLEAYIGEHPDAVFHRLNLARFQYLDDELSEARENALTLVDDETWLPVGFASRHQPQLRQRAASLLVDIANDSCRDAPDDRKSEAIDDLASAVEGLRRLSVDPDNDPLCQEAEGYLFFARGDYKSAVARFDRLARDPQTASEQIYQYAARSLEEINEFGAAYEWLKNLAALRPENTKYLFACATSAYTLRRYEEADRWLDALLDIDPEHAEGLQLLSVVAVALSGGTDSDVSLDPVARALMQADAAMAEGEVETARSTLLAVLDEHPENAHVLMKLLWAEMTAGRPEQAQRYVDDLLERYPENRGLRQVSASLQSENRVQAIEMYVNSLGLQEADRVVSMLVHLESLATAQRGRAALFAGSGEEEKVQEAEALAVLAEEAMQRNLPEAKRLADEHPQLMEYLFRQALRERDWVEADGIVQKARRENADFVALFAGQLALERGDRDEEAVRWLREAVREAPYSSAAWRGLAIAQTRLGNFGEAREAFAQAYSNNPNDVDTVQRYVQLLLRTGDQTAALRIMRTAHRLVPNDVRLRESWLQLEATVGDAAMALRTRRELFREDPDDTSNAKALATYLATARPYRDLLLDDAGEERFPLRRWARMSPIEQRQVVLQTKQAWFEEAQEVLDQLLENEAVAKHKVVVLRAVLLREQGRVEDGQEVLESFITATPEANEQTLLELLLALGFYQSEIGRVADAAETLNRARQYQHASLREADQALGNLYFSRDQLEPAIEAYRRAVQINSDQGIQLRIVECLAKMGRFAEAERELESQMQAGSTGYPEQMLKAAIDNGYGESLYRAARQSQQQGRAAEAAAMRTQAAEKLEQRDEAWAKAEQLSPSNHSPYLQRALAKLSEYQRVMSEPDRDRRQAEQLLEEALRLLNRAESIRAGDSQTSMIRVAVLQTQGDQQAAIDELTRVLENDPNAIDARRRLVQLLNQAGETDRALEIVDDGIRRSPIMTVWHELRGDLHLEQVLLLQPQLAGVEQTLGGSRARPQALLEEKATLETKIAAEAKAAAVAYRQAVQLDATPPLVGKLIGALLNSSPPGYEEAVRVLDEREALLVARPGEPGAVNAAMLKSLYARALSGADRRDDALTQLAEAYQLFRADDSAVARNAMNQWYRGITVVFDEQSPDEIEQFIMDQAPPQPGFAEYSWLAGLYSRQGTSGGTRRALELQRKAVEAYDSEDGPALANLYYNLAIFLVLDRQYQAAIDPFKKAIENNPHRLALNNYAYLLADELRRPDDALPFATRARDLLSDGDPPSRQSDVLDTLGWIHYLIGDANKAENILRQSMGKAVTASNCYHLAAVLAEMDKLDAARTYLDRAAELRPDPRTKAEIDALADDIRTRRK